MNTPRLLIISFVFLASGVSAETVRMRGGHVVSGKITDVTADALLMEIRRAEIQRGDVLELKLGDPVSEGDEFFGKLELHDDTRVIAQLRKLPNGDLVIPKHSVLGDNYLVTRSSIKKITPIGEAVFVVRNLGEIRGLIVGESVGAFMVEPAPGPVVSLPRSEVAEITPPLKDRVELSPVRHEPAMYVALSGQYLWVAGKFADLLRSGKGAGLEYGYYLPGMFRLLGAATLHTAYQNYRGDVLDMQYFRLHAGLRRFFFLRGDHAVFAKISAGLAFEQIRGAKFSQDSFVGGFTAGGGYAYRLPYVTVFLENGFEYYYDRSAPLMGVAIGMGVLYGF